MWQVVRVVFSESAGLNNRADVLGADTAALGANIYHKLAGRTGRTADDRIQEP